MNLEVAKNLGEQGEKKQFSNEQLEKMTNQLKLNELVDLQATIAKSGPDREKFIRKAARAMAAVTAGAILMLGAMGSNEAYAGGSETGKIGNQEKNPKVEHVLKSLASQDKIDLKMIEKDGKIRPYDGTEIEKDGKVRLIKGDYVDAGGKNRPVEDFHIDKDGKARPYSGIQTINNGPETMINK